VNRAELRRRFLRRVNDDTVRPEFWSIDEANQMLQDAQEMYSEEVEELTQTVYLPIRTGKMFYSLRGLGIACMTPLRLWSQQRQHRLWPISQTELCGHYERWLTVTGQPEWWGLHSWDTIFVWPAPTSGGGVFELDCAVWPTPLQDEHDEPFFSDGHHDAFVAHAEMMGRVKQWDVEAALKLAETWYGKAKDGQARAGVKAIQSRYFGREQRRSD